MARLFAIDKRDSGQWVNTNGEVEADDIAEAAKFAQMLTDNDGVIRRVRPTGRVLIEIPA